MKKADDVKALKRQLRETRLQFRELVNTARTVGAAIERLYSPDVWRSLSPLDHGKAMRRIVSALALSIDLADRFGMKTSPRKSALTRKAYEEYWSASGMKPAAVNPLWPLHRQFEHNKEMP